MIFTDVVMMALTSAITAITVKLIDGYFYERRLKAELIKRDAEIKDIKSDAAKKITDAAVSVVNEVQEECAALRERVNILRQDSNLIVSRIASLEKENSELKKELKDTKLHLEHAKEIIDMVLEWVNDYTPALKEAGIVPPNIEKPQFRG